MSEGGESINGFEYCRRRAHMTQVEAASAIGVSQGNISLWERGETYPQGERIRLVAKVYGSTIDELFQKEVDTEDDAS